MSNSPLIEGLGQVLFSFRGHGPYEVFQPAAQGAAFRRRVEMVRVSERGAPGVTFVSAFARRSCRPSVALVLPDAGVTVLSEVDERLIMMFGADASSSGAVCG